MKNKNPKIQAREIYLSMLNAGKGLISSFLAKQCAVIAVNEIIDSHIERNHSDEKHWKKVKKELKNIY